MITASIRSIVGICGVCALLLPACSEPAQERGKTHANRRVERERVVNATERQRMEAYVEQRRPKASVKVMTGLTGDTIDCVDVLAQSALSRQGMQGHQIRFAPRTLPGTPRHPTSRPSPGSAASAGGLPGSTVSSSTAATTQRVRQLYGMNGDICPAATVPMRRLTMDTLVRFETLDAFLQKRLDLEVPSCGGCGSDWLATEHAVVRRDVDNFGAASVLNVWSPWVERADEFSLSQIWVVGGTGSGLQTVEAGWQTYRDLYGDRRSHLFIYFTPNSYGSGGCYNLDCDAFVQTTNLVYLAGEWVDYSVEGGTQYEIELLWYKDGTDGDWWLRYDEIWVGYYPQDLFDSTGLRHRGTRVDFGGEVVNTSPGCMHTDTDMGSGDWPSQGFGYSAYQRNLRYLDISNNFQDASGLAPRVTQSNCYDLVSPTSTTGQGFYFGGPGRNENCP
jgi:hypothetical protein